MNINKKDHEEAIDKSNNRIKALEADVEGLKQTIHQKEQEANEAKRRNAEDNEGNARDYDEKAS